MRVGEQDPEVKVDHEDTGREAVEGVLQARLDAAVAADLVTQAQRATDVRNELVELPCGEALNLVSVEPCNEASGEQIVTLQRNEKPAAHEAWLHHRRLKEVIPKEHVPGNERL